MTHPRDHVLNLPVQLRSDMTTVANVTCKVRVNGGAATTYTNVSSPAIVQYSDCTFSYELKIAASTYSDGDVIEVSWLYSGTAYATDNYVIGPAAVDGAHYTNARGDKLDNADAAVSAVKAKTDLIPAAGPADAAHFTNARGDLLANLDAAVSGRADGSVWTSALAAVLSSLSTRTGTAQAGAAGSITLDSGASGVNDFYVGQWVVITSGAGAGQSRLITSYVGSTKVATVHSNWKTQPSGTSVFYLLAAADIQGVVLADTATTLTNAPADSSGVTTLLSRLTAARAGYLDVLNGLVAAIWAAVVDSSGVTTLLSRLTSGRATNLDNLDATVSSRSTYAGADTAGTTTLLARIASALTITGGKVDVNDKTGFALTSAYDPAKTAAQAGDAMALTSGERTALTAVIWNALTSGMTTVGSIGKLLATNIDAAISSRSTYAGGDTSGTTTLLSRLTSGRATNLDNLDATVSSRSTVAAVWAAVVDSAGVTTLLSRLTSGRATNLDNLDAAISSRSTYAGADTAGTSTLLGLLTPTRAGYLDNLVRLDAAITTRLATAGYTAPDNADVVSILADVALLLTRLPADVWDELLANHTTAGTAGKALGTAGDPWTITLPGPYTGSQAGALFAAMKLKTDLLGTGQATVRSAIAADGGTIEIVIGGDYFYADGTPFLDLTLPAGFPDLNTASSITVTVDGVFTVAATPRSATRLTADLAASASGHLKAKHYLWGVDAIFAGHDVPLARGDLVAIAKLTP